MNMSGSDGSTKRGTIFILHSPQIPAGPSVLHKVFSEDGRIAVKVKRHVHPVGNNAVHAALGGTAYYDADEAWIITTSSFTKAAVATANKAGVSLYGRSDPREWLCESDEE